MLKRLVAVTAFILSTPFSVLAQIPNVAEFNQTFTHHTANVNNVRLHYVMGGKGDAVVLLHGFGGTWYTWRHVMPALAKRYTVIVPDMRGTGDSAKPFSGYDKKTAAQDIYQLVQKLGQKRIYLVGHDIGVMVAYAYAAAHPEDVKRLVLIDSVPPSMSRILCKREVMGWESDLGTQWQSGTERPSSLELAWSTSEQYSSELGRAA